MTLDRGASPAGEQPEPLVEPRARSRRVSSTTTRAAASSIASGIPSSRRQISATAAELAASSAKPGCAVRRPIHEQRGPRRSRRCSSRRPSGGGTASDRSGQTCSPSTPRPSRLVASMRTAGQPLEQAAGEASGRVEQVLAVVEHEERGACCGGTRRRARRAMPAPRLHAEASRRRPGRATSSSFAAASSQSHAPSGNSGSDVGGDLHGEARLADAADTGEGHESSCLGQRPWRSRRAPRSRPTNDVSCTGRLPGTRRATAAAESRAGEPGRTSWKTRSAWREVAEAVLAEVEQLDVGRRARREQLLGGEREHDLAAVRDRHRAARPG